MPYNHATSVITARKPFAGGKHVLTESTYSCSDTCVFNKFYCLFNGTDGLEVKVIIANVESL